MPQREAFAVQGPASPSAVGICGKRPHERQSPLGLRNRRIEAARPDALLPADFVTHERGKRYSRRIFAARAKSIGAAYLRVKALEPNRSASKSS